VNAVINIDDNTMNRIIPGSKSLEQVIKEALAVYFFIEDAADRCKVPTLIVYDKDRKRAEAFLDLGDDENSSKEEPDS
jgi:hypothetical protein